MRKPSLWIAVAVAVLVAVLALLIWAPRFFSEEMEEGGADAGSR